jgi:hypothetical protein
MRDEIGNQKTEQAPGEQDRLGHLAEDAGLTEEELARETGVDAGKNPPGVTSALPPD